MDKPTNIKCQPFPEQLPLLIGLFILLSCSQNKPSQYAITEKIHTLKPPVIIPVQDPVIVRLDTRRPPHIIHIPTDTLGSHIVKSDAGVATNELLFPPRTLTTNFVLFMQGYNTEEGLAGSVVGSSYCDKKGNLWFGTDGGVSRYDGSSFTNFNSKQGLVNSLIQCIAEDNVGNLWFGSNAGVSRYDGVSFTNLSVKNGLAGNSIYGILEDKNGNLWFASTGGVTKLENDNKNLSPEKFDFKTYTTSDGLISNNISAITEDKTGNLWFASGDKGVSRYDGKSFTNYTTEQGLSNNSVYGILADKNGNIWFATPGGGASCYNGKSFINYTSKEGLISDYPTGIFEDGNGDLWFLTRGRGVSRLDYKKKAFTNYTTEAGLLSNNIWSVVEDKTGNLWFSSFGSGVGRLTNNLNSLKLTVSSIGSRDFLLQSIYQDKTGNLWLGGDGDGLWWLKVDENSIVNYRTYQGLLNNHVFSIIEDTKGNVWCGTAGGVSTFNITKKFLLTYTTDQGLSNDVVNRVYEDRDRSLWFCTAGGLSVLDSSKKTFTNYSKKQGLAGDWVNSIFQDKDANFWICTESGISKYDGSTFTNYTTDQGLINNNTVNGIADNKGNLWFATYGGGLSRLDKEGKTLISYISDQGLSDDKVTAIEMDANGVVWLATSKGLTAFRGFIKQAPANSKSELIPPGNELSNTELADEGYAPVFEVYNTKTGYPVKDINVNTLCVANDHAIWVGTSEKLIRFDPYNIVRNQDTPLVYIKSIRLNNENVCWYDILNDYTQNDSSLFTPNLVEEVDLFDKPLKNAQRDTMRKKYHGVKFDSVANFYSVPRNLVLPYAHNNITIDFFAIEPSRSNLVNYQYILEGYDHEWSPSMNNTRANFGNIHEGNYTFKVKAQSHDGIWSEPVIYNFKVLPPWYRTWWAYSLYILVIILALWSFIRLRLTVIRREKTALEEKVITRTKELQKSLNDLKAAQSQLIQSEKMASLGELTAGIAHEIQNPLNFVNNFSEVNKELIGELKNEKSKGRSERDDELENQLLGDIEQNLEKINHHGKRADAIVKGMLQHSRTGSGQKELTDINALAAEYLRLAQHGLKARDKTLDVKLETHFDNGIGKINVMPQDIGRVLVNLINNAFYAASLPSPEKIGTGKGGFSEADSNKTPTVWVSTKKENHKILISVRDNGPGIPTNILDKIFQPFFTTKPPGQGTGLGLSLAYDIVKAHGGEIKVESKEAEGSEFIVQIPN